MMPASPRWMQGAKMRVEATEEDEVLEALGEHIQEVLVEDENHLVIWGSGGTLRTIAEGLEFNPTLLGIDATLGSNQIGTDLNEEKLLKLINDHEGGCTLLVSPMGGQGFLIGRGNLQLSPTVLRAIGIDAVMGVVGTHFRPELINRIDDTVVFHALGRDHIRGILVVQLSYLRARLEALDYGLELTHEATEKLCEAGYDPMYGARPLKRAIQKHLENPLAALLLKDEFATGTTIRAELASSGGISFHA